MDPLLKSLSNDTFKQLVQEQRPEWAVPLGQGRAEVAAPPEQAGPPLSPHKQALRDRAAAAFEYGRDPASKKDPFIKQVLNAIIALGDKRAQEGLPKPYDVAEGFFNPVAGMAGVLVGPRAAKNIGGLAEGKFLAGVQALERGEAPQAVWRTWGVAKNAEGKYVFEPPLKLGESDALVQFQQLYPDVALKVYRASGAREGWYNPQTKEIFAQGKVGVPATEFGSRRGVLEHELQHAADDLEGVSYGTKLSDPDYWNNSAEVRARAVEQRLDPEARAWEPSFHEDANRWEQVIKKHPGAVSEAVKEKGGMWHPEAVERLAQPLANKLLGYDDGFRGEGMARWPDDPKSQWTQRAIRNYLNKYAGTKEDPLKDVEVPFGEGTRRWEDITDRVITSLGARAFKDNMGNLLPGVPESIGKAKFDEPIFEVRSAARAKEFGLQDSARALESYLSHVGDYLRQNVKPEKLAQYDLVRAVKETAANDARVAKEMEKAAQASMKDLPVYKEYPQGFKWVELKKPERLTEEQAKTVKRIEVDKEYLSRTPYYAVGSDGKAIINSYTGEPARGATREEAYLAGQLAQEGNQMGHCVGGYCEGVASGESRIFSLRDAKGRSHVTVEVQPQWSKADASRHPDDPASGGQLTGLDSIVQIKGKQNRAPNAEYLPYVQDFVKSGKWGEVGDLGNTGLYRHGDKWLTQDEVRAAGLFPDNGRALEFRPPQGRR